jgi:hypothetical protein
MLGRPLHKVVLPEKHEHLVGVRELPGHKGLGPEGDHDVVPRLHLGGAWVRERERGAEGWYPPLLFMPNHCQTSIQPHAIIIVQEGKHARLSCALRGKKKQGQ